MRTERRCPSLGRRSAVVALCGLLASACTSVSQGGSQTSLMQVTGTKVSTEELRATQMALAIRLPGIIEGAADALAAQTQDAALRRRALLWKIELVPALYEALFNADPLAAFLDTWVLAIQVDQFLSDGEGRALFAPLQSVAVDATHKVRASLVTTAKGLAKSPDGFVRAQAAVEKWAVAHPLSGPLSSRDSILTHLAEMAAGGSDVSVFEAVGNIPATVSDIAARLDVYAAYLPKAARWEGELMAYELKDQGEADRVLATFASVEKAADRFNQLLSQEAVQQALAQVQKERAAALSTVDTLRQQTQAYVTSEREAALAAVDMERRTVMADVDKQRSALLQEMDALRKQVRQDADELASRIIWRGALAASGLLILAATLTTLVLRHALKARA
jgi:hypothetical protein